MNQLVVGDIDQALEVVEKVGPTEGALEPKVEGVGLSTECCDAGVA